MFFVFLLVASVVLRLFLAGRQLRHLWLHRAVVPARFASSVTLPQHQKAVDYATAKIRFGLYALSLEVLWFVVLTWGGGLNWGWAQADHLIVTHSVSPLAAAVTLLVTIALLSALIDLPLTIWHQFVLEERFGFNRSTWRIFLIDQCKGLILGGLIGVPLILGILWLMGHRQGLGTGWWVLLWALYALVSIGLAWVFPVWIAPIFNRFSPLPSGSLKSRLEALLERCQFAAQGLFVMDGSRRSSHGNAFFAGMGATRRIVLFDTLVETLSEEELEAVLAHEIGHYRCGHVPTRIFFGLAMAFGVMAVFGGWMDHPQILAALGISLDTLGATTVLRDAVSMYLFSLIVPFALLPLGPVASFLSRRHEYEADAFAAREADGAALIGALVSLHRDNAAPLTTDAWFSAFYDSHPPAPLRIEALERSLGHTSG
ncbi:MAG: M48 family metallopeptidase [Candidatus Sericytochromatia bacterium]|nr:M48 family metallopeptidase [Candidatus Sericytochromatia bacterium]